MCLVIFCKSRLLLCPQINSTLFIGILRHPRFLGVRGHHWRRRVRRTRAQPLGGPQIAGYTTVSNVEDYNTVFAWNGTEGTPFQQKSWLTHLSNRKAQVLD